MNYFEHHIGDYRKDTGHLSLLEHGIYRQLLDTYYMDEKPLSGDNAKLMRSHCVRTADEQMALENVLQDFFVRTDQGFIHKRCDIVIEAYHQKSAKAGESAKARWDRVRAEKAEKAAFDANALRAQSDGNANHKPRTNNQKPETNKVNSTVEQNQLDATIRQIFEYWQKVMDSPKSKLDANRTTLIKNALAGYSPADVCKAIRGCSKTPHNMGENKQNTKYNGLNLILRNAEHIDKFIVQDGTQARSGAPETIAQANERIMRELLGQDQDGNVIDGEMTVIEQ